MLYQANCEKNIGLQAQILGPRTFTIFVVMALVTTFATTPLTRALYPHWYQVKIEAWRRGEIDWDGNRLTENETFSEPDPVYTGKTEISEVARILAYLRLDSMPGVIALVSLLAKPTSTTSKVRVHHAKRSEAPLDDPEPTDRRPLQVHGIRLAELTDRASSVMKVSEQEEYNMRDPVVNTFRTFGQLRNFPVSGDVLVVPETSYAATLADKAVDVSADMLLIPWSGSGAMSEYESEIVTDRFANGPFTYFISALLGQATCTTALFVDNGFSTKKQKRESRSLAKTVSAMSARDMRFISPAIINKGHHIFMPYVGGEDDQVALRLVLQLAQDPTVTATIVCFEFPEHVQMKIEESVVEEHAVRTTSKIRELLKAPVQTSVSSSAPGHNSAFFLALRDSLPASLAQRVVFETVQSTSPSSDILATAQDDVGRSAKDSGDLIVLGRNLSMEATFSVATSDGGAKALESEAKQTLGVLADGVLRQTPHASLLVVKAGN